MIFCGLSILTSKKTGETLDNVTMLCYDNGVTLLRKEDAMAEKLISKKELLEKYGISYGALYRWKRKGLIPEEWFIKKSTVTGQETFFPEALICERMERIRSKRMTFHWMSFRAGFTAKRKRKRFCIFERHSVRKNSI